MSRRHPGWLLADVVAVVVFAAVGRRSHAEGVTLAGTVATAAPFLGGTAVGWLVSRAWRRPLAVVRTGVPVWVCTVVIGMVLRRLTGHGTPADFVVVAALVLAAFLLGWRLVAGRFSRRTGRWRRW